MHPSTPRLRNSALLLFLVWCGTAPSSAQLVRQAATMLNLPASLPSATDYVTTSAINLVNGTAMTFGNPMCTAFPSGETNRLYVAQRAGLVRVVNSLSTANPAQATFLDLATYLTSQGTPLATDSENGLLSVTFHPNYNQNGYFYLYFSLNINSELHQRLARFRATGTTGNYNAAVNANPATMTPLLTMRDEAGNHNGGDLGFGPDGYLYLSLGDEGGGGDQFDNARFINKDFWGKMLRLDVDNDPANLVPNPHTQANSTSHPSAVHAGTYRVPADNPFIGYTSWHNSAIAANTVRTEIYATGLRNPFRWSFDPATGQLFLGDVGQNAWEEVDIIVKGGDYGWSWREGLHAYTGPPLPRTPPATGFNPIDPIYEYDHTNDGAGSGNDAVIWGPNITGGAVYRGGALTELFGKYVFAEYGQGQIVALTKNANGSWTGARLATDNQIVDFGYDPRDGELLLVDLSGTIKKLIRSQSSGTAPPATLSATGAFSNLANLTPNPGVVAYAPNVNFWSDYAIKSRWFGIRNLTNTITFNSNRNWTFPTGMVWVKHFDLETTRGVPGTRRKLETRFLVKTATDVYGLSYKWRADQSDADLVAESGLTELIAGSSPAQTWRYPSRSECVTCHTPAGGYALSFNTPQMNRANNFGGVAQNQILALSNAGYFRSPAVGIDNLPAFAPATDTSQSLEWRVRSYLAVNCVQCHQPGGAAQGNWDARSTTKTDVANLINGLLINDAGNAANRFAVPGDTAHSMVLKRQQGNGVPRMPPLGTNERDLVNEQLIADWIASLTTRQNFTQWLAAQSPPVGAAADDPDGDGRPNEMEYLTRTNPNSATSGWSYGTLQIVGGSLQFQFTQPANRAAIIEASSDLQQWHTWDAPGNQPTYPTTDTVRTVTAPFSSPDHFFRVRFSEL